MVLLFSRITHIRDRNLLVGVTQIFQHVLDEEGALGNITFCVFTNVSISALIVTQTASASAELEQPRALTTLNVHAVATDEGQHGTGVRSRCVGHFVEVY